MLTVMWAILSPCLCESKLDDIAPARAVDREFNKRISSNLGGGRRRGCALPHPPAFKRRSAPLAAAVVRFLATEPLVWGSCAAWGRTFSQKSDFFVNKPLVRGSCAAWARTCSQKSVFHLKDPLVWSSCAARTFSQKFVSLGRSRLSGATALPGEQLFSEINFLAR